VGHAVPHAPQLLLSVDSVTQALPQATSPGGQESTQVAAEQRYPDEQARPQAPQFAGSVRVLLQMPLQFVWPD
jgi:hypothetical protein